MPLESLQFEARDDDDAIEKCRRSAEKERRLPEKSLRWSREPTCVVPDEPRRDGYAKA